MNVLLFVAIVTVLCLGIKIACKAKEPIYVTYTQAGCNLTSYILMNIEADVISEINFEDRIKGGTLDEIEKRARELSKEETTQARYEELFGYVPTKSEIYFLKRVVMAECGNTEPEYGIVAVILCIANRVRSDRFPNTINGVLMQRNQFETVSTRRYLRWPVNERVESAWGRVIDRRYDSSYRFILFFTAGKYNAYCIPMYRIGNHYFGR